MLRPLKTTASLILLTTLVACTSKPAGTPPPATLAPLLSSIEQRLAIADQVALSKWDSGKPVEDRARERAVIANATAAAPNYKLSGETVEPFFSAQIEANKLVQYAHLSEWRAQGKAPDTPRPDLTGQIRPQLDRLQVRLLQQLADFSPYRSAPNCSQWLATASRAAARDPLHELALIRATGELCIAARPMSVPSR